MLFDNTDLTSANFYGANLTGVNFNDTNLSFAILPENANTKTSFKALVGIYDPASTIWTDGLPIG